MANHFGAAIVSPWSSDGFLLVRGKSRSCGASCRYRSRRLWAAGLGITVRTTLGLPSPLTVLGQSSGLPKLPQIALSLYTAESEPPQAVARFREILIEELPLRGSVISNR